MQYALLGQTHISNTYLQPLCTVQKRTVEELEETLMSLSHYRHKLEDSILLIVLLDLMHLFCNAEVFVGFPCEQEEPHRRAHLIMRQTRAFICSSRVALQRVAQ